ncbi:hypothetical protein J4216_00450 [Candidatus Woesearchaeota archaeon]|nr:hypothetical protein [Candidatus Woesearchaeota archaeon]
MINNIYKDKKIIEQIKEILKKQGSIQLKEFLKEPPKINSKLKEEYVPQSHSYKFTDYEMNKEIIKFVEIITNKKLRSSKLFELKHKDYKLLSDKQKEREGYKIIIELTKSWKEEFGGFTSIIENNQENLRIIPEENTLSIIRTNKEQKSFIKYINNKAKNQKRIFIELIF